VHVKYSSSYRIVL